jgi:hypothetical protein
MQNVLEMNAALYFHMLNKGRMIDQRKRYRNYYEMCRVSAYPNYTQDSQKELIQFYYNCSIDQSDLMAQETLREKANERANELRQNEISPIEAMEFFRATGKAMHGGLRQ